MEIEVTAEEILTHVSEQIPKFGNEPDNGSIGTGGTGHTLLDSMHHRKSGSANSAYQSSLPNFSGAPLEAKSC